MQALVQKKHLDKTLCRGVPFLRCPDIAIEKYGDKQLLDHKKR
jgi:hypothetical protein